MTENQASWGLCYHTASISPRGKKWWYVARLIHVDGQWWELYRHPDCALFQSNSQRSTREAALDYGLPLLHGHFVSAPSPRQGPQMVWSLDTAEAA